MNIDMIRGVLAYVTAAIAYLIGLIALIWMMLTGTVPVDTGLPALIGLVGGPATFLFAANVTQPIWNAGRISAGVDVSEAVRDQALANYRKAVANAFKDVRDALAAQGAARETLEAETVRAGALEKALKQARLRFDAGIASHLDVLDVERNLLNAELARIDSERARKAALADVFKALGGGWSESAGG